MSTVDQSSAFTIPVVVPPATDAPPMRKRWTRAEYHRLGEQGWFQDQRVELMDGEIVVMSPPLPQHESAAYRVARLLNQIFGEGYVVRSFGPLVEGDRTEPQPDISVVRGNIDEFDFAHPTTAVLLVEVAKTSLQYDIGTKQHLYALMGVPEYWVLDVVGRRLLVHREPVADASALFGHRYQAPTVVEESGSIASLAAPHVQLAVADMLPAAPKQS